MFWLGLITGIFSGVFMGVTVMCVMFISGKQCGDQESMGE